MNIFRAFISGIVIPSILLPFVLILALYSHMEEVLTIPFIHFIPVIWGVWNMLYFSMCKKFLPGDECMQLFLSGAGLGILIAVIGIFWLNIPSIIGLDGSLAYIPLIAAPIIYGLFWSFGVKYLNRIVGIH